MEMFFFSISGGEDGMTQNPETIEEKIKHFSHLKVESIYKGEKKQ